MVRRSLHQKDCGGTGLGAGGGEVVAGVEIFVAEEFKEAAVEGVGAGAGGYVDYAVEAAELRGDVVGFYSELLDAVEDWKGYPAGLGLEG